MSGLIADLLLAPITRVSTVSNHTDTQEKKHLNLPLMSKENLSVKKKY